MAIDELVELSARVAELERRGTGFLRHGAIHEVDIEKQIMRIRFGDDVDGKPFLSPWLPYAQFAGDMKMHTPPVKDQQYTVISPTGDWQQAVALPLTWSNTFESPSKKGDEHVMDYGETRHEVRKEDNHFKVGEANVRMWTDKIKIWIGDASITMEDGNIKIEVGGTEIELDSNSILNTASQFAADAQCSIGGGLGSGIPASRQGTVTSDGAVDVGNFANNVKLV